MKKTQILFFILCFPWFISFGQDRDDEPTTPLPFNAYDILNYKMLSPEAFKFQEYSFLSDDNSLFYGRMNYSIPLYEIKIGSISIPIGLVNSNSGLRVEEEATSVGFGWNLNLGAKIIRKVNGFYSDYHKTLGWYSPNFGNPSIDANNFDQLPDEFNLVGLGLNESFYFDEYGRGKPLSGSNSHVTATIGEDESGLYASSANGTTKDKDYKKITINTSSGLEIVFIPTEACYSASFNYNSGFTVDYFYSVWSIESIKDLNSDRKVTFYYNNCAVSKKDFYADGSNRWIRKHVLKLDHISWDSGSVMFIYETPRKDKECTTKDGTNIQDYALDNIKVLNSEGVCIKNVKFSYNYFSTGKTDDYKDYRLKLTRVEFVATDKTSTPPYTFEYFDEKPFPRIDSKERDFWGYYNASGAKTLEPFMYQYIPAPILNNISKNSYLAFAIPGTESKLVNPDKGISRESNELACKTGMLRKVTLPTGGFIAFDYELNEFQLIPYAYVVSLKKWCDIDYTKKGGGLRLKQQVLSDGITNRTLSYDYNYKEKCQGIISRFPCFSFPTYKQGVADKIYENSIFEPVLQNDAFVGYHVVVEKEEGNGRKEITYNVPDPIFSKFDVFYKRTPSYGSVYEEEEYSYRQSDAHIKYPRISPKLGTIEKIVYFSEKSLTPQKEVTYDYAENIRETVDFSNKETAGIDGIEYIRTKVQYKDWFIAKGSETVIEYPTDGSKAQSNETLFFYDSNNLLANKLLGESSSSAGYRSFSQESYYYSTGWDQLGAWFPYKDAPFSEAMKAATTSHQIIPIAIRKAKSPYGYGIDQDGNQDSQVIPISDTYLHYGVYAGKVLNDSIKARLYSEGGHQSTLSNALRIYNFDAFGRPTLFKKGNGEAMQFASWLQAYDYPKCNGIVAENGDTPLFSSFEPNEGPSDGPKAGAIISDGDPVALADAPLGDYAMHLNYNINGNRLRIDKNIPKGNFKVTFWYKGDGAINGNQQGEWFTTDTWQLFSQDCPGNQSVDFAFDGDVYIDGVRVIPNGALLQTNSYRGLVGTLSQEDANGQVTRYRYDKFNRLSSVRDGDGNILKAYKYSYGLTGDTGNTGDTPTTTAASRSFTFSYTPGVYITVVDDYDHHEERRTFDSGTIQGIILITDGLTGNKLEAPFFITVTSTQDIPDIAARIASAVSSAMNASTTFNNVTAAVEGSDLIVKVSNPNIATDISRFTVTAKSLYEFPSFPFYYGVEATKFTIN